jgi:RNA recognition motif-containing protein
MTNIFVGNLPYNTTEDELQAAFAEFGAVDRVSVVRDRETGQSRGFAFVEMANSAEANKAIDALNGREMNGRAIKVNEARPREARPSGGGGFGGGGGRGRGEGGGNRRREPRW